jgi:hypothetical protein
MSNKSFFARNFTRAAWARALEKNAVLSINIDEQTPRGPTARLSPHTDADARR